MRSRSVHRLVIVGLRLILRMSQRMGFTPGQQ